MATGPSPVPRLGRPTRMTNPTTPTRKLGWKPGPEDPRTLKLARYAVDLPTPPDTVDYMSRITRWPVLGNDRFGDCVFVTTGHMMKAWTTYAGGPVFTPTTTQILAAYSAVTGFNPRTGAGDNGTVSLDALNFWRKRGIAGRKIAAFVRLDHRNLTEVKTALHLFSGVFLAAQLPISASTQFDQRKPWTVVRAGGAKGSWGGHAFRLGAYNADWFGGSTWGRVQWFSPEWWIKYGAEAWAVLSTDQLDGGGLSDEGFNLDQLREDLANIPKL